MIHKRIFLYCENLPQEMADKLDQPWHFVARLPMDRNYAEVFCATCNRSRLENIGSLDHAVQDADYCVIVFLQRYVFVTDNHEKVAVYFGVCKECDTPHWGHGGDRFKSAVEHVYDPWWKT